jgi:hypothetical protein
MTQSTDYQDYVTVMEERDIRCLSLVDLVKRIVDLSDREALHEFHANRTAFHLDDGRWVRLIDYVHNRFSEIKIENSDVKEKAQDMVLDKFSNLPGSIVSEKVAETKTICRIDCRNYFRPFLELIEKKLNEGEMCGLSEETMVAQWLQGFVDRHIHLSILECKRSRDNGFSRYDWILNGHRITLYLPVYMNGAERRQWLETNIPDVNPTDPEEKNRIQSIINKRFERHVKFPYLTNRDTDDEITHHKIPTHILQLITTEGLTTAIAEEKCEKIEEQRESIQKLGKKKLKELILCIFNSISTNQYNLSALAREFSLSKSALCRFAAKNWFEKQEEMKIPDLWMNTCQVLAQHPDFVEAAIKAGVWQDVLGFLTAPKTITETSNGQ